MFIAYLTAGAPDLNTTKQALLNLANDGADVIEIGVPYSDPLADGIILQKASQQALKNGFRLEQLWHLLAEIELPVPVVILAYYNQIFHYGVEKWVITLVNLKVKALIVPDLPYEEAAILRAACARHHLHMIWLISPTTPKVRAKQLALACDDWIYLVSRTGVTGVDAHFDNQIPNMIAELKQVTTTPIALGFGIHQKQQLQLVKSWGADGVIIGTACMQILLEKGVDQLTEWISAMKKSSYP
uniref:Tryptophan synthase alpha chain n=1 Tax=Cyanidiococcus yangmingshanensis TaxID=2690220 RepID=A0A7G5VUT8_9RHOD|nr:tryptophan synthase alpha subunit [Cyanidiococcus yangmingshanensis]QMX77455.1 tryptophan synthase alpha subunit [Cyanidiococcus yangmingshanensis]